MTIPALQILALPVFFAITCLAQTPADAPPGPPRHAPGMLAPDLAYVRLADGRKVSLVNAHRGKIVVLEFWATWCAPCQPAMAEFQQLAAKYANRRNEIEFLTISVDGAERATQNPPPTEAVRQHLEKKGWTAAINGWSTFEQRRPWDIHGVPVAYVIGPDGRFVGDPMQDLKTAIVKLLAEPQNPRSAKPPRP